jgi:RNA polymerase sigma factor (sigma-70 family)
MKDYRIKITVRNDRILSAIEKLGYPSVNQFCKTTGLNYERTNRVIRGESPTNEKGRLRKIVSDLLEELNLTLEDAFTPKQLKGFISKHKYEMKLDEQQMIAFSREKDHKPLELQMMEQDVKNTLDHLFQRVLTPREERVIRMRYGIGMNTEHSLEEVGLQFSVTRERVRQIEIRALKKLKHPTNSQKLFDAGIFNTVDNLKKPNEDVQEQKEASNSPV